MSGDEFQSRYASVMEAMLKSAVQETSQLFQTMVEELKAEMSQIKRENEELRSKCRLFEKKALGSDSSATTSESNSNTNVPGEALPPPPPPPRSHNPTKCDSAIQCDLVPVQVGELYCGTKQALKGEKGLESRGDGYQNSGLFKHIAFEEKRPTEQPSSNGECSALQQEAQPDQPATAEDNEQSCEGETHSQASGPEDPPLPRVEKMEQQSRQISSLTLIDSSSKKLPESKEKPGTAEDKESSCEGGTRNQASGPENPTVVTPLPWEEKMDQQSQQVSALVSIEKLPESTHTKGKPFVTPAVADRAAEVTVIVQPERRRGRPPEVQSSPPADVLVDQGTGNSTLAREEKIEVRPPPVASQRTTANYTTANPPSADSEEEDDYSPLSPLSQGEQLSAKPNICLQLEEKVDELALPSPEAPSATESQETSPTKPPKSLSSVQSSHTKYNRSISYPSIEDAMLLIEAMNVPAAEEGDATTGNKLSVLQTTSAVAKQQRSLSASQTSDQQCGGETSAAPTLQHLPRTESTPAQPPLQQFTLRIDSQTMPGSPSQSNISVAQVKTLLIPTTHYALVSPQMGRRITVVTPKLSHANPQKIIVVPRSLTSSSHGHGPQAPLSTSAVSASLPAENVQSPVMTAAVEHSTQASIPTVTLKTMATTTDQSLSSSVLPQASAKSSDHLENDRPRMPVPPQQVSVVVAPGLLRSKDTTTQTSTAFLASTSSQKCDVLTLTKTSSEDSRAIAVSLVQPSPSPSQESSATVSTQMSTDNPVTTLSQKLDKLTPSSKTNPEDSNRVAVPLAQPCPLTAVNLATTSQKCDSTASTKTKAADSKTATSPTGTCSSSMRSISATDAPTVTPLPPTSPKKMSAVVKLTMLSLPALRNEILKRKEILISKRLPVKRLMEASIQLDVPRVVHEVPQAEVESSQRSLACEQEVASVSVTSPSETRPCSQECPVTAQVQHSVAPKVPTVAQEKPAKVAKSSEPMLADIEALTSTQASSFLKEGSSHGCTPDTAIEEMPSGALLRLSSVASKDFSGPHLKMTKVQFLAQLAVTPVAKEVKEQAPFNRLMDTSVRTDDRNGVDENTALKRRGSRHHTPQHNPASRTEAESTHVKPKKARLGGGEEVETPTETPSSLCSTHKSSPCESFPTSSDNNMTKNGSSQKKANNAPSPPVSLRRSRLSDGASNPGRNSDKPVPHVSARPRFTRECNRKRSSDPALLRSKRLTQDDARPRKCGRRADVKTSAAVKAKTLTKAGRSEKLPHVTSAKKMARAQMFANAKKLSKAAAGKAQESAKAAASSERSGKTGSGKRLAKSNNVKALSKPTDTKNTKTSRVALGRQRAPKAAKAEKVKTENEESEIEPDFAAGQRGQSEGGSANNKLCQTGRIWTVPRMEARGGTRSSNNNDTQAQQQRRTPKTPPHTPVRGGGLGTAAIRPPMPIVSPLQPLAVIGQRLLKNQCGECGRILGSAAALESHVSTAHAALRRPFSCCHCGKNFPDAKCLRRHDRVHRNGRIHVCAQCGKGFVYTFGLTKHLQMVHGTVKPFACNICKKGFHTRRDMEIHTRIHTGEKPYECNLCEKRFKRRVELNQHLRWHNGEKRHWCPYCGKGFLDRNNLKVHKLVHTGEKPHHCTHCPKKFTQTGHLKKHLRNVHKV